MLSYRGTIGRFKVESPTIIRYRDVPNDELFVSAGAAKDGVKVTNESGAEKLVILKRFGPRNPAAPKTING